MQYSLDIGLRAARAGGAGSGVLVLSLTPEDEPQRGGCKGLPMPETVGLQGYSRFFERPKPNNLYNRTSQA